MPDHAACAADPDAIGRGLTVARPLLAKRTLGEAAVSLQMNPAPARRAVRTTIVSVML